MLERGGFVVGKWLGPAFYNVTKASIGLQAGVDSSEVLVLVMSEEGLDRLVEPSLRLGTRARWRSWAS